MSLFLYCCNCGGCVPLIRRFLKENHYRDWLTQPIIQGKDKVLQYLSTLPENLETGSLIQHIQRSSSFTIVQASPTSPHPYKWVDIGHATMKDRLDAEILIEEDKQRCQ